MNSVQYRLERGCVNNKGVHMDHITLNNGVTIPQVGLGTYLLEPDDAQ